MTSANLKFITVSMLVLVVFSSCGSGSDSSNVAACPQTLSANNPSLPAGANIVPITLGTAPYANPPINQPLVSVTICTPGTSTCQTINNILLDTGSYGLRIFRSLISVSLPLVTDNTMGHTLAECVGYITGSQWGPIANADVYLGQGAGEYAAGVNIQEVDSTYPAGIPSTSDCYSGEDTSPAGAGNNGILGVGLISNDCGTGCTDTATTYYFSCLSGNCTPESVASSKQTTNPISKMPAGFNNGVSLTLPSLSSCGNTGTTGYMALGVGTQSNNTPPAAVNVVQADPTLLTMLTTFQGTQNSNSFIDSGSNTLGFYPTGGVETDLGNCGGNANEFFCPSDSPSYTATMQPISGGTQVSVPFQIVNSFSLIDSNNTAFSTLGSYGVAQEFDWGINFFYGRTVYVVLKNKVATGIGTGPLWAF